LLGGGYYFLIRDLVETVNEQPEFAQLNFATYNDPENEETPGLIHWIKYPYVDHILVKFTFEKKTSYITLPFEYWRKNSKIINAIIKAINNPSFHLKNTENE
jgi:hypothetical protein